MSYIGIAIGFGLGLLTMKWFPYNCIVGAVICIVFILISKAQVRKLDEKWGHDPEWWDP